MNKISYNEREKMAFLILAGILKVSHSLTGMELDDVCLC